MSRDIGINDSQSEPNLELGGFSNNSYLKSRNFPNINTAFVDCGIVLMKISFLFFCDSSEISLFSRFADREDVYSIRQLLLLTLSIKRIPLRSKKHSNHDLSDRSNWLYMFQPLFCFRCKVVKQRFIVYYVTNRCIKSVGSFQKPS